MGKMDLGDAIAQQHAAAVRPPSFAAYLLAQAAWFLMLGEQMVLFPYLVRVVLGEGEVRFGIAQMAMQAPTGLLILFGGVVADRFDRQRILAFCALLAGAVVLAVAAFAGTGALSYELMITYAVAISVIGAFVNPARDALLSQVAPRPGDLQQAVSFASIAIFAGQLAGMALAAAAPIVGTPALLLSQVVLMAAMAWAALRTRPRPQEAGSARGGEPLLAFIGRQLAEGFSAAFASPTIASVLLGMMATGVFSVGCLLVAAPLLIEALLRGQAAPAEIASAFGVFNFIFWIGAMLASFALMRLRQTRRRGLILVAAVGGSGLSVVLMAAQAPFFLLCAVGLVWGATLGLVLTLGRGIVLACAPDVLRARVLSIFMLVWMLSGALGALLQGFLVRAVGPQDAMLISGGALASAFGGLLSTPLRNSEPA